MKYPAFDGSEPCTQVDPELFYDMPHNGAVSHVMKQTLQLCMTCSMLSQCRDYALHHETEGIWGGTTPVMRKRMRRALKITVQPPILAGYIVSSRRAS